MQPVGGEQGGRARLQHEGHGVQAGHQAPGQEVKGGGGGEGEEGDDGDGKKEGGGEIEEKEEEEE